MKKKIVRSSLRRRGGIDAVEREKMIGCNIEGGKLWK
jgi:hypothetical protein